MVEAYPLLARAEQCLKANRIDEAAAHVMAHLRQHPGEPRGLVVLGTIAQGTGALSQAERFYRKALEAMPRDRAVNLSLAQCLNQQEKLPEALALFERFRSDDDPSTQVLIGLTFDKLGRHEEALHVLANVVERTPDRPHLWLAYAQKLRSAGRTDEALNVYRRVIARIPDLGDAWWGIASIKKKVFTAEDITAMHKALDIAVDDTNIAPLHFALGRAHQAEGRFAESFRHYEQANGVWARMLNYDEGQLSYEIGMNERLFTADFFANCAEGGDPSDAPIFIVSLPRSGSTLLEQMLGSHPEIEPLGELSHIPAMVRILMEGATRAGLRTVPEAIVRLGPEERTAMGREYLRRAAAHRKTNRPHFVDKMPHNWSNSLLIRQILPNAKVIDIRRDAMTCCWSNFSHSFSRAHSSSFGLRSIGQAYAQYVRLMKHLDRAVPGWMKHVAYDRLIEEPETVLRTLFEELGLSFDEAVLRFHESKRVVRTPSAEQVRRPLNREGVGTWKPYEEWLGPLKEVLGELAR